LVALLHNRAGGGRVGDVLARDFLRGVDGWIVNSAYTASEARRVARADRPTVVAAPALEHMCPPSSQPVTEAEIRGRGGRVVRILCVANPTPVKGLERLLEALGPMAGRAWRLRLVGDLQRDPVYVSHLRRAACRLGIALQIDWVGSRYGADLAREYRGADLFVLPSLLEGFGLAHLEAMAFGLPVVASRFGAAPELMDDGVEGRLIDPGDTAAFSAALRRLVGDGDLRARCAVAARARATAYPVQRWDQTAAQARELIATLGRGRGV
jgi:glycosyltransferase involved in cell wall biosynthesis